MKQQKAGPVGLAKLDSLETVEDPAIQDYVDAVSEYVLNAGKLSKEKLKAAQIRLSLVLGRALVHSLAIHKPGVADLHAGERQVAGALRVVQADVSGFHSLDGLRLAVEIKPVNLAIGRAIWNRFGDIRSFAVNLHLKFPFAVVGGIMPIAAAELVRTKKGASHWKDTTPLIRRAVNRLVRAGGRRTEGDAPHLLEAVCVIAYDPQTADILPDLPAPGLGLRWDEFVTSMAMAYDSRFADDTELS